MAARKARGAGPAFVRWFGPVLEALRELGGSGRPTEVSEWIAQKQQIPQDELDRQNKGGVSRFENQVAWARLYLVKAGYLGSSQRGVWSLTELGRIAILGHDEAIALFKKVHASMTAERQPREEAEPADEAASQSGGQPVGTVKEDHRQRLLALLRSLPAAGFEQLCQRLLRESGFQQVKITGKSGDGGIDGYGIFLVNSFLSFQVYFQCKRYSGSVGASTVRDFRGAMQGRADKGLILTTGTFTSDARKESIRDGVPPIELVDAERLLDKFEELELGLTSVKAYEIDASFFREFQTV
jgi:restriction system protein